MQEIILPSGEVIAARRSTDMENDLITLISEIKSEIRSTNVKVDNMDSKIDLKLENVKTIITNLEDKYFSNMSIQNKKIDSIQEILEEHLKESEAILDNHSERLKEIEKYRKEFEELQKETAELKAAPLQKKAGLIDGLSDAIKNAIFIAIGAGIVTILGFLIKQLFLGS